MMYDRIAELSRPASSRPKMSAIDRAAQFSAFAALVGLDEQMNETARLVDSKIELSEDDIERLNRKLLLLSQKVSEDNELPEIRATCFVPDERKSGGAYVVKIGIVKRVDEVFHKIMLTDGSEISISDILDLEVIMQRQRAAVTLYLSNRESFS